MADFGIELWKQDLDVLSDSIKDEGAGVLNGLAPSVAGSGLQVDVAAGIALIGDTPVSYAGGNVTPGAASGSFDRIDTISISNAGTLTATAGTASRNPIPATLPANHVLIGYVRVNKSATTLNAIDLIDRRYFISRRFQKWISPKMMQTGALTVGKITVDSKEIEAVTLPVAADNDVLCSFPKPEEIRQAGTSGERLLILAFMFMGNDTQNAVANAWLRWGEGGSPTISETQSMTLESIPADTTDMVVHEVYDSDDDTDPDRGQDLLWFEFERKGTDVGDDAQAMNLLGFMVYWGLQRLTGD